VAQDVLGAPPQILGDFVAFQRAEQGDAMADSLHEINIAASVRKVYDAWTTEQGLCAWWTAKAKVSSTQGQINVFAFDGGAVEFHFRIDEQTPERRVLWTGVSADKMPDEWVGTKIDVRLNELEGGRTRMRFAHRDWQSTDGAFAFCNSTWGELMHRLRDYCEGRGRGPLFSG
jgi:uncharacterized protein YndB with AHSA1/START domain